MTDQYEIEHFRSGGVGVPNLRGVAILLLYFVLVGVIPCVLAYMVGKAMGN
jgi:hypothetical protein